MRRLELPLSDHQTVYDECIRHIRSIADRTALVALQPTVIECGSNYLATGIESAGYELLPFNFPPAEKQLIKNLYEQRLRDGSGRKFYDQIRSAADICPYCGFGEVMELDHFLPKAHYPELNVCPANLVPSCHKCNGLKDDVVSDGPNEYFLNPYFDHLPDDIRWLEAELVLIENGPTVRYGVRLNNGEFGNIAERLRFHFAKLQLGDRFRKRAAQVLREMEQTIDEHLGALGSNGIAEHFRDEGNRISLTRPNSIETAAYFAASENLEYCRGAYRSWK
jgi:hypothetical protein